ESYLLKATKRLKILPVLLAEEAYSDVVREAQEIVELALKGMLRQVGVEPPRWHDVGSILREHRGRLPDAVAAEVDDLATISARLRKDRELSFYGDIDFIPTEHYTKQDAQRALADARRVVSVATAVVGSE
ncbi:MAG: HEPN domain-containing protein, partial [Acidobacteria bacterium]|nr:HEPN domain-containing protein [Acidobacteriota bacterium]